MFVRCIMASLIPFCGMRGLQACVGDAGHFHLEIAHSHDDHCDGHPTPCDSTEGLQCEHSDDHLHIGLTIDDPAMLSPVAVIAIKGKPQVLATSPPDPATVSVTGFLRRLMRVPRPPPSFQSGNSALLTIVLRL